MYTHIANESKFRYCIEKLMKSVIKSNRRKTIYAVNGRILTSPIVIMVDKEYSVYITIKPS